MNTWGISGPQFLILYGTILVVTGAVVFAIRRRISGRWDRVGLAGLRAPELSPYEVAILKGGDSLALTVAVCRLKEAGALALAESGSLEVAGPLPPQPDPLEKWAYAVVQESPGRSKAVLDKRAAEPALAPIRERLWALGLLLEPRQRALIRWQLFWFVPVFGLGVARLIAGSQNHRPVGLLVLLMLAGAYGAYEVTKPPIATLAGTRVLKQLEQDSSIFSSYGFAGDVALSGFGALWAADATLATALGLKQGTGGFGGGGGGCGGGGGGCGG
jgi:uncharacterized protein (TIGR04222 family)